MNLTNKVLEHTGGVRLLEEHHAAHRERDNVLVDEVADLGQEHADLIVLGVEGLAGQGVHEVLLDVLAGELDGIPGDAVGSNGP